MREEVDKGDEQCRCLSIQNVVNTNEFHVHVKNMTDIFRHAICCRARKALTRGRTDHITAGVTYLQIAIQVCFPCTCRICFPQFTLSLLAERVEYIIFSSLTLTVISWENLVGKSRPMYLLLASNAL